MIEPNALTATLGVLGFVVSVAKVLWDIRQTRPRLHLERWKEGEFLRSGHMSGKVDVTLGKVSYDRPVTVVCLHLGVSNHSARHNTLVRLDVRGPRPLKPATCGAFVVGYRRIDLRETYGLDKVVQSPVTVGIPEPQWDEMLPLDIPGGSHRSAFLVYEMEDPPAPPGRYAFKVEAIDAFGRRYRRKVVLTHE